MGLGGEEVGGRQLDPGPGQLGPGAEPQVIGEEDGEEQEGRQGQSPSLRPLGVGEWLLVVAGGLEPDLEAVVIFLLPTRPSTPGHILGTGRLHRGGSSAATVIDVGGSASRFPPPRNVSRWVVPAGLRVQR